MGALRSHATGRPRRSAGPLVRGAGIRRGRLHDGAGRDRAAGWDLLPLRPARAAAPLCAPALRLQTHYADFPRWMQAGQILLDIFR
ncbi:MAG: hypothetical protein PHX05_07655, partial [Acidobacteriota bacterium]|nr:hypothetical protein [Acidobacteriota bacterium]